MSASVVQLSDYRPHSSGDAICLDCRHEWVAVAPTGTTWMECPECALLRGRFKGPHWRSMPYWECKCGNDLFHATESGMYCPNCGVWQEGHT